MKTSNGVGDFKISKVNSRKKPSSAIFFFIILAVIFTGVFFYYINSRIPRVINYNDQTNGSATTTGTGSLVNKIQPPPPSAATSTPAAPSVLNLKIPFTSQAPTGNWDTVHNEDCEEASSLMANAYLTGNTSATLPASQVDDEMTKLNGWEDKNLGYHLDTTAAETAQMIQGYYGLNAKVVNGYTLQDIKDQLNQHHVVILAVNGQVIGNPNYTQPGPIYHMLVIRGYTSTGLITNDSGTRRGENYPYTFATLHSAGADWDHNTNTIDQSKKPMIVVWK